MHRRARLSRIAILFVSLMLGACAAARLPASQSPSLSASQPPVAPAPTILKLFDYEKRPIEARVELKEDHPGYEIYRVVFPSYDQSDPINRETVAWYYRQKDNHRRAAIVQVPILGGDYEPEKFFASHYAEQGFHALLIERKEGLFAIEKGFQHTRQVILQTIIDQRRCLDWWLAQPEVDPHRLGVTGISMGGMLSSLLVAVDDRIAAAVLMLNGADFPRLLEISGEPEVIDLRARINKMYGWDAPAMRAQAAKYIADIDPRVLAPRVDPRKVLVISARFDDVVPFELANEWWEAAGRPQRLIIPTGHYSSGFFISYVFRKCCEHFRAKFGYPEG